MDLNATSSIVTGGASGIGLATAKRLTWCARLDLPQHFPNGLPSNYKAVFEVVNKLVGEGQPRN